jgi:hypothetical protein
MPVFCNYITRHILHHYLGDNGMYRACGGFLGCSMAWAERWNKFLKRLSYKSSNALVTCANKFSDIEIVNYWRANGFLKNNNIFGSGVVDWDKKYLEMPGTYAYDKKDIKYNLTNYAKKKIVDDKTLLFLHAIWAHFDDKFDDLLRRYNLRKRQGFVGTLFDFGSSRYIKKEDDIIMCRQTNDIISIKRVVLNKSTFRIFDEKDVTDNSYIKVKAYDEIGDDVLYYGRIIDIFIHSKYIDGQTDVFLHVLWFRTVNVDNVTGLTIVKLDPQYHFNYNYPYYALRHVESQNIVLWPLV